MNYSLLFLMAQTRFSRPTVNEVGHSGEFKQNVFIREYDDRVVKYYFIPNETMVIGKAVEMRTNYLSHYEGMFDPIVICIPRL